MQGSTVSDGAGDVAQHAWTTCERRGCDLARMGSSSTAKGGASTGPRRPDWSRWTNSAPRAGGSLTPALSGACCVFVVRAQLCRASLVPHSGSSGRARRGIRGGRWWTVVRSCCRRLTLSPPSRVCAGVSTSRCTGCSYACSSVERPPWHLPTPPLRVPW